jgi:hypothetical protein
VSVYSKHAGKSIKNSAGNTVMYNMDGSSPSGFTNSTFSGMSCSTLPSPAPTPTPTPTPTVVDYSKVVVKSLKDLFA